MIEFLRQQLKDLNGRVEIVILFEGSKRSRDHVLVAADEIGVTLDTSGVWYCVPWNKIQQISKPILEPDIPPS